MKRRRTRERFSFGSRKRPDMIISEARANVVRRARSEPLGATYRALASTERTSPLPWSRCHDHRERLCSAEHLLNLLAPRRGRCERESRLFDPFRTICTQCWRGAHHREGRKISSKTDSLVRSPVRSPHDDIILRNERSVRTLGNASKYPISRDVETFVINEMRHQ